MFSCRQIYDLITEYDEGGLTTSERRQFESHIIVCPPCRGFVSQIRATRRRLGKDSPPEFTAELENSIVNAFRAWKVQRR